MASAPDPKNGASGVPEPLTDPPTIAEKPAEASAQSAASPTAEPEKRCCVRVRDWCREWVQVAQVVQGFSAALALVVSAGVLIYLTQQLAIQESSFKAQVERLKKDSKEKEEAGRAERLRFQHAQTSRFIDDMNKIDLLYVQHPYITEYMETVFSENPAEDNGTRSTRLRKQFKTECWDRKRIILSSCEMLANFMDAAILQRESLDSGDWNRWWNSFMDNYDENPILQDFLEARADWYKSREALSNRKKRYEYYLNGESKRLPDHACFR